MKISDIFSAPKGRLSTDDLPQLASSPSRKPSPYKYGKWSKEEGEFKPTIKVNQLADQIEKVQNILKRLTGIEREYDNIGRRAPDGVYESLATWRRIAASLKLKWDDAMVEVETKGNYYNE